MRLPTFAIYLTQGIIQIPKKATKTDRQTDRVILHLAEIHHSFKGIQRESKLCLYTNPLKEFQSDTF